MGGAPVVWRELPDHVKIEVRKSERGWRAEVTANGEWLLTVEAADRLTAAMAATAVLLPT